MMDRTLLPGIGFLAGALVVCAWVANEPVRHCPAPNDWIRGQGEYGLSAASIVELSEARTIKWDSQQITWSQLAKNMQDIRRLPLGVLVIFRPDSNAPCDDKARVRAMMRRWLECQSTLCGEGPEWDDFKGPGRPNV